MQFLSDGGGDEYGVKPGVDRTLICQLIAYSHADRVTATANIVRLSIHHGISHSHPLYLKAPSCPHAGIDPKPLAAISDIPSHQIYSDTHKFPT